MQQTVRCIDIEKILLLLWKTNVPAESTDRFLTEPGEGYDHPRLPLIPQAVRIALHQTALHP